MLVLAVMAHHMEATFKGWVQPVFKAGWLPVDGFFVLSGFLIMTALLREHSDRGTDRRRPLPVPPAGTHLSRPARRSCRHRRRRDDCRSPTARRRAPVAGERRVVGPQLRLPQRQPAAHRGRSALEPEHRAAVLRRVPAARRRPVDVAHVSNAVGHAARRRDRASPRAAGRCSASSAFPTPTCGPRSASTR